MDPVYLALIVLGLLAIALVVFLVTRKSAKTVAPAEAPAVEIREPVKKGLDVQLAKTRSSLGSRLAKFFQSGGSEFQTQEWEELEEVLLEGDVGIHTTTKLLDGVRSDYQGERASLKDLIRKHGVALMGETVHGARDLNNVPKPFIISVVGINGVGKTTTIGKLAQKFKQEGKTVLLGAVDTFRAGAIQQLKIWSERVGTDFVTGREGADPGAVAFDSVTAGKARGSDVVLLDTAGRLHTKANLMEELKKIHRVVKKVIPEAPHETWLVVDGTLGQNSVQQAKEFQKALELTGVIITKLDGTAKGGAVLAIASELKLPIRYIGVGESVEDLVAFSPQPFIEAIIGS